MKNVKFQLANEILRLNKVQGNLEIFVGNFKEYSAEKLNQFLSITKSAVKVI